MKVVLISNCDLFFAPAVMLPPQVPLCIWSLTSQEKTIQEKIVQFSQQCPRSIKYFSSTQQIMEAIRVEKDSLFFLMGYPEKIKLKQLGNQRDRIFNIHFGPLPEYKGPAPVFWQIKRDPSELGLCIHRLTEELDGGPVMWEKFVPNNALYNFQVAHQLMSQMAVEGILFIFNGMIEQLPLTKSLRSTGPSRCQKRPQASDIIIDWNNMNAVQVAALVRSCNPWNKGAPCLYKGQQLNILLARPIDASEKPGIVISPGQFLLQDGIYYAGCAQNSILQIQAVYWQESFWSEGWI